MAEFRAYKYSVRMSPRKARLVADLIRGKKVGEAAAILRNSESTTTEAILKTLTSACANANYAKEVLNQEVDMDSLYVKTILIDGGAILKRMRPRAKGSGNRILKRTSHVTIVVADRK